MDKKVIIIKLDNPPNENKYNKKKLYKDILSSSDKIKELIKKTKRNKLFVKQTKETQHIKKKDKKKKQFVINLHL